MLLSDIMNTKRKHRKEIFEYLISRYGIDKSTQILNDFFDKKWDDIPGKDILDMLTLIENKKDINRNNDTIDAIERIIRSLQHTVNELKTLKKKL